MARAPSAPGGRVLGARQKGLGPLVLATRQAHLLRPLRVPEQLLRDQQSQGTDVLCAQDHLLTVGTLAQGEGKGCRDMPCLALLDGFQAAWASL